MSIYSNKYEFNPYIDDFYDLDPYDQEVRENLELMESDAEMQRAIEAMGQEAREDVEILLWEDEVLELLSQMQFKTIIDLEDKPRDRLIRIRNHYHPQSVDYDDLGNEIDKDPFPHYVCKSEDEKKEFFDLGYRLGITGELGVYYKLLPLIEFSRGYWLGTYRRGMDEKDDNTLQKLKEEIAVYDPLIVQEELSTIINSSYVPPAEDIGIIK